MTSSHVDMLPVQAMEVAAGSPWDLGRFLDALDDQTLQRVGQLASQIVTEVARAEGHRKFATLWQEVGKLHDSLPEWPQDTAAGQVLAAEAAPAHTVEETASDLPAGVPDEESTQIMPAVLIEPAADPAPPAAPDPTGAASVDGAAC